MSSSYDGLDRLVGVSAPGLTPIGLAYDVAGRRTSLADEAGTTGYAYDGLDRVTAEAHSVTGTVSYG